MPLPYPDVILLENMTAPGAGPAFGIGGGQMRFDNNSPTGVNKGQYRIPLSVNLWLADSQAGATATVQLQSSDTVGFGSPELLYTWQLALVAGLPFIIRPLSKLFKIRRRWVRLNLTAIAGGNAPAVNAYADVGEYTL